MNLYIKKKIIKKQGTSSKEIEDYIAVEKKLKVSVNGKDVISLYCTPSMIKELLIGLFLTEGILPNKISPDEMRIEYGEEIKVDIPAEDILTEEMAISRCLGGVTLNKKREFEKVKHNFSITFEALKTIFN